MQGQHRLHQGKFVAYDPSTQVPLLIRGPGIPAGSAPQALVWNGDITSTILQMAGAGPGLPQDGQSILRFAQDPTLRSTRPILFETGPPGTAFEPATTAAKAGKRVRVSKYVKNLDLDHTFQFARAIVAPRYRGIRTGRYLLVKYGDRSREMYDLLKRPVRAEVGLQGLPLLPGPEIPAEAPGAAGQVQRPVLRHRDRQAAEAARQEEEAPRREADRRRHHHALIGCRAWRGG